MNKINVPKSLVTKIKNEVITELLINKKVKLDSKKDLRLSPIDHGIIADSVLSKISRPKDGKDGENLIYSDQIRNDLVDRLLPRIPEPLDGETGERGKKGEKGTNGEDYILTDQDKLDISDITEKATRKSVNQLMLRLISDIKSGKISKPNAGIGPKDALDLINQALGNTDWQSGGTNPITTRGDVIRGDSSGDAERLALGTNGQVLGSDGTDLVYISIPGGGDMLKSTYDTGDNGIVDNSEGLEGNDSAYHLSRTNHAGTQAASTISDFDTEVANETNVAANTDHRGSDGKNHSDVVLNNTHRAVATGNPHSVTKTEVGLSNVDNLQQIPLSQKGAVGGVASLDGSGTVPASQLPNSVQGAVRVIGFWNANTNIPDLSSLTLTDGEAYQVSVSGSTSLNGETNWKARDLVVWEDGLAGNWFKIDNTDEVLSVASKTGAVTLDTDDVSENTNLYYTEARVNANTNVAANTTHSGLSSGNPHSVTPTELSLVIGTDVLAEQTIGISDNNLLEVDGSPNSGEYGRFTANGFEGRTESEFKTDFNLEIGTDVHQFIPEVEASDEGTFNSGNPNGTLYILVPDP